MMMNIMMTMMITMMIPSMMTMMMTIMMTLRIHTCTMLPAHSLSPCWHSKCNSPFSSSVVWWRKFWSYVWWLWWHLWPFWWHYGKYVDNPVDIQNATPHLRLRSSNEEYFDHMSDIFHEVFLMTLVKPSSEQNCIVLTIFIRVLTISMTVFMFDNFDESCDNVDKTFDKFWYEPERLKRQFHEKAKGGKWRGQIHGEKSCRINFIKRSMTGIHEKWKWKIH